MLVHELAHFGAGEGVHTERLSVVSGELRVFEVPGHVQDHDQLLGLLRLFRGVGRRLLEVDRGAILAARLGFRGRVLRAGRPGEPEGRRQGDRQGRRWDAHVYLLRASPGLAVTVHGWPVGVVVRYRWVTPRGGADGSNRFGDESGDPLYTIRNRGGG